MAQDAQAMETDDGMKTYKITEMFYSLQGEGAHAGTPAVFVRFAGCNLNCPWCDTNHTVKSEVTAIELANQALALLPADNNALIVFTGGEPSLQLDNDAMYQFTIRRPGPFAIETNGTHLGGLSNEDWRRLWVTVSPKPGHPVQLPTEWIDEVKVVLDYVTNPEDHAHLSTNRFIQPCWPGDGSAIEDRARALRRAVDYVKEHPWWRLSLQTQRMLVIR